MEYGESIILQAHRCIKNKKYEEALKYYNKFTEKYSDLKHLIIANKTYCNNRLKYSINFDLNNVDIHYSTQNLYSTFSQLFNIEQTYLACLQDQEINFLQTLREVNIHTLKVTPMFDFNANIFSEAQENMQYFKKRNLAFLSQSTQHISKEMRLLWKDELDLKVFEHLLFQKSIFEDALKHGYERILILENNTFFNSDTYKILKKVAPSIPTDFKVLLLQCSESINKNSSYYIDYQQTAPVNFSYPIPGYTLNNCATIYDKSIFEEIVTYIKEYDGPFDKATMGAIYQNHKKQSFVLKSPICSSTNSFSNNKINDMDELNKKTQIEKLRYLDFIRTFIISLHISKSTFESNRDFFYNFSEDNILLHINIFSTSPESDKNIKDEYSDIIVIWPDGKNITKNNLFLLYIESMLAYNRHGGVQGEIDGIIYSLECFKLKK